MVRRVKAGRRHRSDADLAAIMGKSGPGKIRTRIFVRHREQIKAAQQMTARYWNKKTNRFGEYWIFGKGSKSRTKNAY